MPTELEGHIDQDGRVLRVQGSVLDVWNTRNTPNSCAVLVLAGGVRITRRRDPATRARM